MPLRGHDIYWGAGTLARGWDFKLQYHPAIRIILQKTREMDRDPLCPNFLQTERYEGTLVLNMGLLYALKLSPLGKWC